MPHIRMLLAVNKTYNSNSPFPINDYGAIDHMINKGLKSLKEGNSYVFSQAFVNKVNDSRSSLNNVNKQKKVNLYMPNVESELAFGILLSDNKQAINDLLGAMGNSTPFDGLLTHKHYFSGVLQDLYLENIQFLNAKTAPDVGKNGKLLARFIDPFTGKKTSMGGKKYREIYGNIRLQSITVKELTTSTIDYDITTNCVVDYLSTYAGMKKLKNDVYKILDIKSYELGLTYLNIFDLAKHYNFDVSVYDFAMHVIDTYECTDSRVKKKHLKFMIKDNHMYVLDLPSKNKALVPELLDEEIYDDFESVKEFISEKTWTEFIITKDYDLFLQLCHHIKEKYICLGFSDNYVLFKTNKITFDDSFNKIVNIMKLVPRSKSPYTIIDSFFGLKKGCMNNYAFKTFETGIHVINFSTRTTEDNTIYYDVNKCYQSILLNGLPELLVNGRSQTSIIIGIPSITDEWLPYNGERILDHDFYEITVKQVDNLLYKSKKLIMFGLIVNYLSKENMVKTIHNVFKTTNGTAYLGQREEFDEKLFDYDIIRMYIGWLNKTISINNKYYNNLSKEEVLATESITSKQVYGNEECLTIKQNNLVVKTGRLSNLAIIQLANLKLYLFNKEVESKCPHLTLVYSNTDCLGYHNYTNNKQFKCNLLDDKKIGHFKTQYKVKTPLNQKHDVRIYSHIDIVIKENTIIDRDVSEIHTLLKEKKSFQICGSPGYGKSYTLKNTIIPYFKKNGYKYKVCSTTIDNTELLKRDGITDATTIQSLTNLPDAYALSVEFSDINYLIIDESSQIDNSVFKCIEHITSTTSCKIILIGDKFQCKPMSGKSLIDTPFVCNLADNNVITLKWHKNVRYDKSLNDIIVYCKDNYNNKAAVIKYIESKLKVITEPINSYNIAYRNKVCKHWIDKGLECYTIHSKQGTTINEPYTIHEYNTDLVEMDVLYTALSRGRAASQITLRKYEHTEADNW